ncbi:hypothetical protein OEZ86_001698 [Tetradesmus obliquus]|nr:hypothetical protein OEZ86_001698 [Tetradesmus obliquus]
MSTAAYVDGQESQEFPVVSTPAVSSPQSLAALAAPTVPPNSSATNPVSQRSDKQSFVDGLKYGAAGGIAGAFAKSCTAPLARLTILYQVQGFTTTAAAGIAGQAEGVAHPPKLRHAFLQVVRREGVAALWKGNLATILHRLPYSSINFYTYEHANKFLVQRLPPGTDFARTLAAGGLAGLVACSAAYPLDLVRTRLAVQTQGHYYHGILPTLQRIVADEGAVGLYRGLGATLLQVVPSLALNFSLLASGCISGFLTATVTFPLDVVRRRMQVYGRQHQGEPVSYSRVIRQVQQQGGLKGFYTGILPEYCKVVPGVAIAFCTYEQLKKWLQAQ